MKIILILLFFLYITIAAAQQCANNTIENCPINKGLCAGSVKVCHDGIWSACSILPKEESCANYLDDNCDGIIDEDCICKSGETKPCEQWNLGICSSSIQTCLNNTWSDCSIKPSNETCNNGADDDCDGKIDLNDDNCIDKNHCRNNIKDFDETETDCGGILCLPCASCSDGKLSSRLGEKKVNVIIDDKGKISDCGGLCPPCPTCNDGIKNQLEEQIDCGGINCPKCNIDEPDPEPEYYCGDNRCDVTEDFESCPDDCKSDSNILFYLLVLIILVIILLFCYILIKKQGKTKKKTPPLKIHSSLLKPIPNDNRADKLTEELKKIK